MGEVYRARDSRLDRDVAIKVSATEFSERFTREARSIAALNHSNVCHVYDVGPDYLVLEYVEGTSPAGPMPFEAALPLIRQLIDGIDAARITTASQLSAERSANAARRNQRRTTAARGLQCGRPALDTHKTIDWAAVAGHCRGAVARTRRLDLPMVARDAAG